MNNFYKETKKYKKNRLEFKNKRVYSKLVNDKSKIIFNKNGKNNSISIFSLLICIIKVLLSLFFSIIYYIFDVSTDTDGDELYI